MTKTWDMLLLIYCCKDLCDDMGLFINWDKLVSDDVRLVINWVKKSNDVLKLLIYCEIHLLLGYKWKWAWLIFSQDFWKTVNDTWKPYSVFHTHYLRDMFFKDRTFVPSRSDCYSFNDRWKTAALITLTSIKKKENSSAVTTVIAIGCVRCQML